jgi:hypothetical protein
MRNADIKKNGIYLFISGISVCELPYLNAAYNIYKSIKRPARQDQSKIGPPKSRLKTKPKRNSQGTFTAITTAGNSKNLYLEILYTAMA